MQKIINTALCSFGMSGTVFHAPFINLHPGFNLYAVWERTKQLSKEQYPWVMIYTTLEELLKDEHIDLVVVNTPNYTHYDYTKKALEAGKDVVVEKPFTITSAEAKELIKLAAAKNKTITVFQNRRWDSDFKTVKKIVTEKWLGDIVEAEIHFDRFNANLSARQHKEVPGAGTGVVYDLGPHLIDQALQLFGMPQALFADLECLRPQSQIDDYMEVLLYYPKLRVRLKSSYFVREPLPAYIINGTKGTFYKSRADVQEALLLGGSKPNLNEWGREPEKEKGYLHTEKDGAIIKERIETEPGNYFEFYGLLYEALVNQTAVPVIAEEGLQTIQIIEAIYQSKESGCCVKL